MIQPNSLRLGNIVFDNLGGILKIKGISTDSDLSHLRPIRLNETWLTKLGFQEGQIGYYYNGDITVSVEGQVYFGETETWIAEISYVHQLQNITHALTGQEPTIK